MNSIEAYIDRLVNEQATLESRIQEISEKIRVAREIQEDLKVGHKSGTKALVEALGPQRPLAGLRSTKAVARYMELHPDLDEVKPYTLYRRMHELGYQSESRNIPQITSAAFVSWAKKRGWYLHTRGVWRRPKSPIRRTNLKNLSLDDDDLGIS